MSRNFPQTLESVSNLKRAIRRHFDFSTGIRKFLPFHRDATAVLWRIGKSTGHERFTRGRSISRLSRSANLTPNLRKHGDFHASCPTLSAMITIGTDARIDAESVEPRACSTRCSSCARNFVSPGITRAKTFGVAGATA